MVKQRQSVVIVFRSKYVYLHEKICEREQGTKRKGVKKVKLSCASEGSDSIAFFSIFALNFHYEYIDHLRTA